MNFRLTLLAIATLFLAVGTADAQVEIVDYSIDGGSGIAMGGPYTVTATIGQPDANNGSSGGNFVVTGGTEAPPDTIILGDVNGDGVVNLLDVAPFVEVLSNGEYIPEADVNQDGVVNLLDVDPFIQLLGG